MKEVNSFKFTGSKTVKNESVKEKIRDRLKTTQKYDTLMMDMRL
jgi:hypothetical protein